MIPASPSPSSAREVRHLPAGPLDVAFSVVDDRLRTIIEENLRLYDVDWALTGRKPVSLVVVVTDDVTDPATGNYLECAQMLVDTTPTGLRATTSAGAALIGSFTDVGESWHMTVPSRILEEGRWPDIEDLLSLVWTTGWRRAGWVPLHAAGLASDHRGVLVCAAGGGGKTTLTLALVRHGWRSLGDDKLLLGTLGGDTIVAAVKHVMNVDPAVTAWFPELGDLHALPEYSSWTVKRRLSLARFRSGAAAHHMRPSHLLLLARQPDRGVVSVSPLTVPEIIAALLRQSVIPRDASVARPIVAALARQAAQLKGIRVDLPADAFADSRTVTAIDEALS